MVKKFVFVSLALICIVFSQPRGNCFAATGDTLDQAKQKVVTLIDARDSAKADMATNKLIADFSKNPGIDIAVHQISLKYQEVKNYQKEIELSRVIIKNWPDLSQAGWAQMDIVIANLLLHNESAARAKIKTLISQYRDDPNLPWTLYAIGEQYRWTRNYDQAKELYEKIIRDHPDTECATKARIALINSDIIAKIDAGDFASAEKLVDKMLTDFPTDSYLPDILFYIGQKFTWCHQYEQAGNICQQIVREYPNAKCATKAKLGLMNADILAKIESGDGVAAGRGVDKMIAEFSSDADLPEMLLIIAQQLSWKHQYEQAGNICQQIVQKYPTSPIVAKAQQCISKTGQITDIISKYIESGDYGKAGKAVDELIAKFGDEADTPAAIYEIANRLEATGQFVLARQVYEQIIWRYPKEAWADMSRMGVQRTKALAFDEIGDEASAKSTFDGVLSDFKGNSYLPSHVMWTAEGYYRKACKAREKGDTALAKKLFNKTLQTLDVVNTKFPASDEVPNALYLAGECYYQLEDYQKSADTFQKVADSYPKFQMAGNALFMVAESQQMLKKSGVVSGSQSESQADSKTRTAYEQLLQKYPGSPLAAAAQRWLDKNSSK
jgi:TolA-binding protein